MSQLTAEFLFEIGDTVYVRGSLHDATNRPTQFIVCERLAREYHGGIQQLYKVGNHDMVEEVLLTDIEPPYRYLSEDHKNERAEIQILKYATQANSWRKDLSTAGD